MPVAVCRREKGVPSVARKCGTRSYIDSATLSGDAPDVSLSPMTSGRIPQVVVGVGIRFHR